MDIDRVEAVKQAHESDLMADPAVMAVGVGADERNSALITVYVETGHVHGAIPAELEGVPTRIISTDPHHQHRPHSCLWMERAAEPSRHQFLPREAATLICLFPVWTRRTLLVASLANKVIIMALVEFTDLHFWGDGV